MPNPSSNTVTRLPSDRLGLASRALAMSFEDAAWILTLADEPGLILDPGEPIPAIDPRDLAAARLVAAWETAHLLNGQTGIVQ